MKDTIYYGTRNISISVDVLEDISDASRAVIRYLKPDGKTKGEWVGSLSGLCTVVALTGNTDLRVGTWFYQAKIWFPNGQIVYSDMARFTVLDSI